MTLRATRDQSLETLRGLAILMVVCAHAIGRYGDTGLSVPDDSFYRRVFFTFDLLHMPLFAALAGAAYDFRRLGTGGLGGFLGAKARRILLPFLVVAPLQYVIRCAVQGPPKWRIERIWTVVWYSFDAYWFLQAIFLVFVVVAVVERLRGMDGIRSFLCSLAGAVAVFFLVPKYPHFAFFGLVYLLPFFVLGIGLHRFAPALSRPIVCVPAAAVMVVGLAAQQLVWAGRLSLDASWFGPLSLLLGSSWIVVMFRIRRDVPWLALVGTYSYAIYLFHMFFLAGSRIVLQRWLHVASLDVLFAVSLASGVVFPCLLQAWLVRTRLLGTLLLGLRPRRGGHLERGGEATPAR